MSFVDSRDIDLVVSTNQTLIRYVSEFDPKAAGKTKGGYLMGAIKVPKVSGNLVMRVSLCPTQELVEEIMSKTGCSMEVAMAHPLLLHNVRIGQGTRDRHLEPVPCYKSWNQTYIIDTMGNVRICNDHQDVDREIFLGVDEGTKTLRNSVPRNPWSPDAVVTTLRSDPNHPELGGNCIIIGKNEKEMNLKELQPKQKSRAKPGEANITDILLDRVGNADTAKTIEAFYENQGKKKMAINMKMFRIRVQFFRDFTCQTLISAEADMVSDVIKDTGNKKAGALDISHAINLKSCCKGGRQVSIHSEYTLEKKDVKPVFGVFDPKDNGEDPTNYIENYKLNQPDERKMHIGNLGIVFRTPEQNIDVVSEILSSGYQIKLLLHRKFDDYESPKKFVFTYINHESHKCIFCDLDVDGEDNNNCGKLLNRNRKTKPGVIKRFVKKRKMSSMQKCNFPISPASSSFSESSVYSPRSYGRESIDAAHVATSDTSSVELDDSLQEYLGPVPNDNDLKILDFDVCNDDSVADVLASIDFSELLDEPLLNNSESISKSEVRNFGSFQNDINMQNNFSIGSCVQQVPNTVQAITDLFDVETYLHTPTMMVTDGTATRMKEEVKIVESHSDAESEKISTSHEYKPELRKKIKKDADEGMEIIPLVMVLMVLLILVMMLTDMSQTMKMVLSGIMGVVSILFYFKDNMTSIPDL